MTKVAIYARYSSDMQKQESIEDQIRLCEERIKNEGWEIVDWYTDPATSGASILRPGVQSMLQHARERKFDLIIMEALDRLSRDQEDVAAIYKRLNFFEIKLFTPQEGEISPIHIGLKGTMNALYLSDLAFKVKRGHKGRIEKGMSAGGVAYGYDVVRKFDSKGLPIRGERKINPQEAEIVRRIFREYAGGKSPKAIAIQLNAEGIPSKRGAGWNASTINGHAERGGGVIANDLYVGKLIYNRTSVYLNPDTEKKVARPNPKEEWTIHEVPELRVIDDELWETVQERRQALKRSKNKFWSAQRPRYLLSGLLKCGCCGGSSSSGGLAATPVPYATQKAHAKTA